MNHEDEIDYQEIAAVQQAIEDEQESEWSSEDVILCRMPQVPGFENMGDLLWMTDESEVKHQVSCHADTLAQSYRALAEHARCLVAALQVQQDAKNAYDLAVYKESNLLPSDNG